MNKHKIKMCLAVLQKSQLKYSLLFLQNRQFSKPSKRINYAAYESTSRDYRILRIKDSDWRQQYNFFTAAKICGNSTKESNFENFLDEADEVTAEFSVKNILYLNHDGLMEKLNDCADYQQLFEIIKNNKAKLKKEHLVQSVIILYHLSSNSEEMKKDILNHSVYPFLKNELIEQISYLTAEELSCCFMYLSKMNDDNLLPFQEFIHQSITSAQKLPLTALSRIFVALSYKRENYQSLIELLTLDKTLRQYSLNDAESAGLFAICCINLSKMGHSLSKDILNEYAIRVDKLIQSGELNKNTTKIIVRILSLFNLPYLSLEFSQLSCKLLTTLAPNVDELNERDLSRVSNIFAFHNEPASAVPYLAKATDLKFQKNPNIITLGSALPFLEVDKREAMINWLKKFIHSDENWALRNATAKFYMVLRGLKVSDPKLCDIYWKRVLQDVELNMKEYEQNLKFLRYCHQYMNFNNNLGGTYRFQALEKCLSNLCWKIFESGYECGKPNLYTRLASFVLAYGCIPYYNTQFPYKIIEYLNSDSNFDATNANQIHRGVSTAIRTRFFPRIPNVINRQVNEIYNSLDEIIEKLYPFSGKMMDLNLALKVLCANADIWGIRSKYGVTKNFELIGKVLEIYNELKWTDLTSRNLKEIAYSLNQINARMPLLFEKMLKYISVNENNVTGSIVEKVLTCIYNSGYEIHTPEILECANSIILRDFDRMDGTSLVQVCLALGFQNALSEELVQKIFCASFMKRLENEVQICYSKATHPYRVLNLVMQLNRAVCLDMPQCKVPWFQQNFVEAQMSKAPSTRSPFKDSVRKLLEGYLKDKKSFMRSNITTPYGYLIDFVIYLDQNKNPIEPPQTDADLPNNVTRLAILLFGFKSYAYNGCEDLIGPEVLKVKHLEILGYNVLQISPTPCEFSKSEALENIQIMLKNIINAESESCNIDQRS